MNGGMLQAASLKELHAYWDRKRAGRAMPFRSDIVPTEIPKLLPMLFMVDVEHEPRRFRYRLIGTGVVALTGRDLTGRAVDEQVFGKRCRMFGTRMRLSWNTLNLLERAGTLAGSPGASSSRLKRCFCR